MAFVPSQAVIKKASLKFDPKLLAQEALPIVNYTAHVAPEREVDQSMKMVRHEEHYTHRPFAEGFIHLNALKNYSGALGRAEGINIAVKTANG